MNKSQSKYYNTACLMNEALIALLEKRKITSISRSRRFVKGRGVNRSTFYLHYETIDDLLLETIEYIMGQMNGNSAKNCGWAGIKSPMHR